MGPSKQVPLTRAGPSRSVSWAVATETKAAEACSNSPPRDTAALEHGRGRL